MQSRKGIEKSQYGTLAQTVILGLIRIFITVNANFDFKFGWSLFSHKGVQSWFIK